MPIHDKELIRKRFAKHLAQYNTKSVIQLQVCCRVGELIDQYVDTKSLIGKSGYEFGAGTGFLTKIILDKFPNTHWLVNDLVAETKQFLNNILVSCSANSVSISIGDAEKDPIPNNLGIITSASTIQWFDSVERFIGRCGESLDSGGYLILATFGVDNFREISQLLGEKTMNYHRPESILQWADNSGFNSLFHEQYITEMIFDNPHDVMRYMKETGINGNSSRVWTKSVLEEFYAQYIAEFSSGGRVSLTFNPQIYIFQKKLK